MVVVLAMAAVGEAVCSAATTRTPAPLRASPERALKRVLERVLEQVLEQALERMLELVLERTRVVTRTREVLCPIRMRGRR